MTTFSLVLLALPVAAGGSRLGHVMIDPKPGLYCDTFCAEVDHPEREEIKSSSGD